MTLYDYPRSSAAYRVRIALGLKGLDYQQHPVPLLEDAQFDSQFTRLNPNASVPVLMTKHGAISQSLAIIEYLEEAFPYPRLLPPSAHDRARCRAIAQLICCDIHPLNNLRVLNHVSQLAGEETKMTWYFHWLKRGFDALEAQLKARKTHYCCANVPTLADICLVPQLFNAHRFEFDLSPYPNLLDIEALCIEQEAFIEAHPENQP
ncbi:maleylacetoacetate isomerase [Thaumasiovibrio subtropicus]|uniref:maleylacetoacetate isomerase n=1 Tax=Thaumasiovibrio subtropicus TaxID=1891207 RepID=UPI000B35F93F|nr:maleylacetoacetate isomerase [Thaumasiovibrio subtropicus]